MRALDLHLSLNFSRLREKNWIGIRTPFYEVVKLCGYKSKIFIFPKVHAFFDKKHSRGTTSTLSPGFLIQLSMHIKHDSMSLQPCNFYNKLFQPP